MLQESAKNPAIDCANMLMGVQMNRRVHEEASCFTTSTRRVITAG